MNTDIFYPLLLCFASGFTQCFLLVCCIRLFRRHSRYQFHRSFAVVLLMLSLGFLNNFIVSACYDSPVAAFINTLLILYDYVIVGAYMVFIVTLVFPSRYSALRLALFEVPYLIAMLLFAITRSSIIYPVVQIFTLTVSSVLLVWLGFSIKRYDRILRDNVGSVEYFDLRWAGILIVLLYVVQLIWAVESLSQLDWFTSSTANKNLLFDTLWCVITILYVMLIMHKITQQQVFVEERKAEDAACSRGATSETETIESGNEYYKVLGGSDVDSCIRENKFYLDTSLTLQKLATHLGTNRQYLSNYINREKQKTFYEYINDFRLEEAKNLLDHWDEGRHHSMEDIAALSGFNSYSTFLRSFVKRYDESPSRYLKNVGMR